jgi:MoaA/NifB/PqqE/SkfB family radical SAM enzyme
VIINDDGDPFNIKQHSITEIVNSKYMQSLRQDFRANGMPDACRSCQQRENRNQFSRRQIAPYKLKNIYGEIIWEDDVVTPRWIGGNLGNLCNLKCRICNPNWSSSIAVEKLTQIDPDQRKNSRYYQILQDCNWSHHGDKFWQELKSLSAHIRNFEFLGGEPLLYKENLNFIRYLVDSGLSKNCMFEFTTNGTQYPETLDQIDQFQRFTFTVSIDNLDKKFEFERSGAKWDQVAANLSRMISQAKLNDRIKVGANIIVNIQNVLYLPELLKYLIAQGINFYTLHILSDPTWLSIYNLTERARELTLDKLSSADVGEEIQRDLDIIMNLLKKIQPSDGKEFCSNMKLLDNTRQENFAETHYEIAQAMGYML